MYVDIAYQCVIDDTAGLGREQRQCDGQGSDQQGDTCSETELTRGGHSVGVSVGLAEREKGGRERKTAREEVR